MSAARTRGAKSPSMKSAASPTSRPARPTYDFYGADRIGANLFGDCLLALDARTGKRLWHFQAVHHDLWDYDLTTGPKLLTVKHDGKTVDVVAQPTKFGFLYVFDRVTGKPLWPIEERPVPKSDVPGEQSWPTQPFPTRPPPFTRQKFTVDDINPYIEDADKARLIEDPVNARNEGLFTPPAHPEHDRHARRTRRQQLGRGGGRPRHGLDLRPLARCADDAHSLRAPAYPRARRRHAGAARPCASSPSTAKAATGRTEMAWRRPRIGSSFAAIVRTGRGQMPGFYETALRAQDLDALAAYLLNPAAGAMPAGRGQQAPPPPPGQTRYYTPYGTLNASNGLARYRTALVRADGVRSERRHHQMAGSARGGPSLGRERH